MDLASHHWSIWTDLESGRRRSGAEISAGSVEAAGRFRDVSYCSVDLPTLETARFSKSFSTVPHHHYPRRVAARCMQRSIKSSASPSANATNACEEREKDEGGAHRFAPRSQKSFALWIPSFLSLFASRARGGCPSANGPATAHGRWRGVEGTPRRPYTGYVHDLVRVERQMRLRRKLRLRSLAACAPVSYTHLTLPTKA